MLDHDEEETYMDDYRNTVDKEGFQFDVIMNLDLRTSFETHEMNQDREAKIDEYSDGQEVESEVQQKRAEAIVQDKAAEQFQLGTAYTYLF